MADIIIDPTKIVEINNLGASIRKSRERAANLLRQVTLLENEVVRDEARLKAILQGMATSQPSQDVSSLMVESVETKTTPSTSHTTIKYQ